MPKPGRAHKVDLVSAAADGGKFALIVENQIDPVCASILRDYCAGPDETDAVVSDRLRYIVLNFCGDFHTDETAGLALVAGVVFRRWFGG